MKRGVIFDMDGVLVASGPAHRASWQALARRHGIDLPEEAFLETFGMPSRDIVRRVWGPQVTDAEIKQIDDEKEAFYRSLITGMVPLTVGTREVLGGLAESGFVLVVATSGPPENLELVLHEAQLGHHFAATVHGFDIEHGKPAPDCFLLAAERVGLPPANCVVVEDAPVGIASALAAGMKVIGLVGTHPDWKLHEAGATHVVDRLGEITSVVIARLLDD